MLDHPYINLTGGVWLRGNLHAHTNVSDGQQSRQAVIDGYAACGCQFLMLSDHDLFTSADNYERLDHRKMILIPGNEVTQNGVHVLHVNASRLVPPGERQKVIEDINSDRGFAVINHPNWKMNYNHCSIEQLRSWTGYAGIEIYNGVIGRLEGNPYATDKWDMLLSDGRRAWGFANDDSHCASDIAQGWNVAYVRERTKDGLVDALRNGRFYASTGVDISVINVDERKIRITAPSAQRIIAMGPWSTRLTVVDGSSIEFEMPADVPYVRFECWGTGEQFAWTQPFFTA